MKRLPIIVSMLALASNLLAGLTPEQITLSYTRSQNTIYPSTNVFLTGSTLLLTNCTAYVADTGTAQDLTGLSGYVTIANAQTSAAFPWAAQVAASGTFYSLVTLPTNASYADCGVWLTLTNSAGVSMTYKGENRLHMRPPFK